MRAGRMALYCDTQVVSLISGCPGNMIVKRSSRLENSFQSCPNEVPDSANTRADDSNGRRRIIVSPVSGRISVPQLERRFQGIALDSGLVGEPHLKRAPGVGRRIVGSRSAKVGKEYSHDACIHVAWECADDRFAAAVGVKPQIR